LTNKALHFAIFNATFHTFHFYLFNLVHTAGYIFNLDLPVWSSNM